MQSGPYILSIDQGTSGTKAIVFSLTGEILSTFTTEYGIDYPASGRVEIRPDELWNSVIQAVSGTVRLLESAGGKPREIRSIGISNQRESFLLWDGKGEPLCPVVVWQCKRSADLCRRLGEDPDWVDLVSRRTGLVVDPYFSGTKASVVAAENPEIRSGIRRGEVFFGTVDTWLGWRLTGGRTYATDRTNASRTMMFDIDLLDWDEQIVDRLGLSGMRFPEVLASDAGFGVSDLGGILPGSVPVGSIIGDSHAAAFGEGLFRAGEAKVTLGTGSSILMNVGSGRSNSRNGMVSTVCWSSGDRTDYALEGIVVSCGSTITWLKDNLRMFDSDSEIDELAASVEDAENVYLVPAFSGIGAPWWKLDARASISGLAFGHDRRHVARAALESIIFQTRDVLAAMEEDRGGGLDRIMADGGITVSSFVMQGISDLAGARVSVPSMKQASAWGAALLAGLSAGLYENLAGIDRLIQSKESVSFRPKPDPALAGRYSGWRARLKDY